MMTHSHSSETLGRLTPVAYDKKGPLFDSQHVDRLVRQMIGIDWYFTRRAKQMSKDLGAAKNTVDEYTDHLMKSVDRLVDLENSLVGTAKQVSGKVRDSTQKLANGLSKIEGIADFDRLDRYVALLERADTALSSLATLEESGRLDKIGAALR